MRLAIHLEKFGSRYSSYDAVSFEISESGISAATPNILFIGEKVELYPIWEYRMKAMVRRKNEGLYGFEFVGLSEEQSDKIREDLPLFKSMLDV